MKYLRKLPRDPYSWSYHNDLIAATSHDLKYHVSLGIGEIFQKFLLEFYSVVPKPFSSIYFISASETESHQPAIGMITSEAGILRMLEHPVAKEFSSFIPWLYRESFYVMRRLIMQMDSSQSLPEVYKNIEDLRWVNHKLSRRSMLEEVIAQLTDIKLSQFWEAIPSDKTLEHWLSETTAKIKCVIRGEVHYVKIALPCNENYWMPAVIFWLQLLDTALAYRYPYWKVYWNDQYLLFFNAPHTAIDLLMLYEPEPQAFIKTAECGLPKDINLPLIRLLTCWGDVLKLQ